MVGWLSWLFDSKAGLDAPAPDPLDELRRLRARRRQLVNNIGALRAYGFDTIAQDDEAGLRAIDRKIHALQLKSPTPSP